MRRFLCVTAIVTVGGLLGPGATGAGAARGEPCTLPEEPFGDLAGPPGVFISTQSQEGLTGGQTHNPGAPPGTGPPLVTNFCNPNGPPTVPGS
jgi:hypothetical protein